jgi:hypothetical protein
MSVRLFLDDAVQRTGQVSISTGALLVVLIAALTGVAAYRDPKVATAIGAACAVVAVLVVVLEV